MEHKKAQHLFLPLLWPFLNVQVSCSVVKATKLETLLPVPVISTFKPLFDDRGAGVASHMEESPVLH